MGKLLFFDLWLKKSSKVAKVDFCRIRIELWVSFCHFNYIFVSLMSMVFLAFLQGPFMLFLFIK